jgi:hypothetical protein
MTEETDHHWHLDKRVPLALMVTLALQSGAFVWWAAKADNRLEYLERTVNASAPQIERVIRLEAKMDSVAEALNDVKVILRARSDGRQ